MTTLYSSHLAFFFFAILNIHLSFLSTGIQTDVWNDILHQVFCVKTLAHRHVSFIIYTSQFKLQSILSLATNVVSGWTDNLFSFHLFTALLFFFFFFFFFFWGGGFLKGILLYLEMLSKLWLRAMHVVGNTG